MIIGPGGRTAGHQGPRRLTSAGQDGFAVPAQRVFLRWNVLRRQQQPPCRLRVIAMPEGGAALAGYVSTSAGSHSRASRPAEILDDVVAAKHVRRPVA